CSLAYKSLAELIQDGGSAQAFCLDFNVADLARYALIQFADAGRTAVLRLNRFAGPLSYHAEAGPTAPVVDLQLNANLEELDAALPGRGAVTLDTAGPGSGTVRLGGTANADSRVRLNRH